MSHVMFDLTCYTYCYSVDPLPSTAVIRVTVIHKDPTHYTFPIKNGSKSEATRFMEPHHTPHKLSSYAEHDCIILKLSELPCECVCVLSLS